jgi:hypothetical protein
VIQAMQEQTAALVEALRQPSAPVDYEALAAAIAQAIAPLMRTPERVIEVPIEAEVRREQAVFNFQNENESVIQRKKPSKKLVATIAWMLANDPDLKMKTDEVSNAAGVSYGTVDNARKAIRSGEYKDMIG